jgi:hypothetical protein
MCPRCALASSITGHPSASQNTVKRGLTFNALQAAPLATPMSGLSTTSQPRDYNDQHGSADHESNKPAGLMTCSQSNDPQHGHHREHDDAPSVSDPRRGLGLASRILRWAPLGHDGSPFCRSSNYKVRRLTWMLTLAFLPRPPDRCRGTASSRCSPMRAFRLSRSPAWLGTAALPPLRPSTASRSGP